MEMGKNADESACGTTNSIDPLKNIFRQNKFKNLTYSEYCMSTLKKITQNLTYLRFELSIRRTDHSRREFLESYLQNQFYRGL